MEYLRQANFIKRIGLFGSQFGMEGAGSGGDLMVEQWEHMGMSNHIAKIGSQREIGVSWSLPRAHLQLT